MIWLQYWLCFTSQDLYPTGDDGLAMLCSTCVCGYRTAILFTDALHAVLDPHGEIHQAPEMVQLSVVLVSDAHGFTICDCDIFVAGPKDTIVVRILLFTWPCLVIGPQYSVLWQLMEARRENHPLSGGQRGLLKIVEVVEDGSSFWPWDFELDQLRYSLGAFFS